jgi:hypothetical protein
MSPINQCGYFLSALDDFKELITASERYWPEELCLYKDSLESEDDKLPIRFGYRRDQWANLESEFPQLQRKSYLVMLMALFEDFLKQLCEAIKDEENIQASIFNSKHSGIDAAKEYIKKNASFNFPCDTQEWVNILNSQKIRNVVVHAAGFPIEERHASQIKIIKNSGDLLVIEECSRKHLILGEKYLYTVIETMEKHVRNCVRK